MTARRESLLGLRLLIADDDPLNNIVNRKFLELAGAEVHCVEDGAQAIELLSRSSYDAVLMDLEMSRMDGYEATNRIRRGDAGDDRRQVPIIAVTAHATQDYLDRAIRSGANLCLTKPFNAETLYKRVEDATGR